MTTRPNLTAITQSAEFYRRSLVLATEVAQASDVGQVTAILAEAAGVLGADAAAFASFVKADADHASYRFILACDPTWCLEYDQKALYLYDPWLAYVRRSSQPTLTSNIPARTPKELEFVALATKSGFRSAVIVPALAPQGLTRIGALCLGSDDANRFDDEALPIVLNAATALALRLHEWQIWRLRQDWLDEVQLSTDELFLLQEERMGHRSKHTAAVLNLTPMTVDSRWQRLNAKMGVPSRQAAAQVAAEYGLI